ncbi:MAG: ABC transporter permease subunit [Anaerolinea sp.]|nr:ABC transporter permease subunit [Anaerolinea sp.]
MANTTLELARARTSGDLQIGGFKLTRRTRGIVIRQIFLQLFLLFMVVIVVFPVLWIISMATDPRGVTRPTDLVLIPANANLDAFTRLLTEPFTNVLPLYFGELMMNSLFIALGTSLFTVILGSSAAYAFSRFRFIGRQAGMLGFIILLLLPTTGVVIPLYVLFSSLSVSSTVAALPPAFFASGLIAIFVYLVFSLVKNFGKRNPDRSFNPSPQVVAAATALLALVAIFLAFFVMFQRSPLYRNLIDVPVSELRETYTVAQDDYNQRVGSVAQREQTAVRREDRAAAAEAAAAEMVTLNENGQAATDLAAFLTTEISARQTGTDEDEDNLVLQALIAAQTALNDSGVDAARAALAEGVTTVQAEAVDVRDGATSARANAEEAKANLATAEQTLIAARDAYLADAASIYALRDSALVAVLPYVLLAWGAALAAAAVLWGITRALRGRIEPRTAINILAWAVCLGILLGLGLDALQYRIAQSGTGMQTLRTTLLGLALAFASGGLPFAIWNLKGYFDTIPKELEEAALIDGAGLIGTFFRIMIPLALPAFAIVILFSFMNGWTEFILSWVFLTGATENYTLAMALATLANGANTAPPDMQKFAAMAILISIPILALFFGFQRWIVGGLAIGGVKG